MTGRIVTGMTAWAVALALAPASAAAHDGHVPAPSWEGLVHWFASPTHLVWLLGVLAVGVAWWGALLARRRSPARPAREVSHRGG